MNFIDYKHVGRTKGGSAREPPPTRSAAPGGRQPPRTFRLRNAITAIAPVTNPAGRGGDRAGTERGSDDGPWEAVGQDQGEGLCLADAS
jgi:hypothetical protein